MTLKALATTALMSAAASISSCPLPCPLSTLADNLRPNELFCLFFLCVPICKRVAQLPRSWRVQSWKESARAWERWRKTNRWRATADEDGHYCFAVAL